MIIWQNKYWVCEPFFAFFFDTIQKNVFLNKKVVKQNHPLYLLIFSV